MESQTESQHQHAVCQLLLKTYLKSFSFSPFSLKMFGCADCLQRGVNLAFNHEKLINKRIARKSGDGFYGTVNGRRGIDPFEKHGDQQCAKNFLYTCSYGFGLVKITYYSIRMLFSGGRTTFWWHNKHAVNRMATVLRDAVRSCKHLHLFPILSAVDFFWPVGLIFWSSLGTSFFITIDSTSRSSCFLECYSRA